MKAFHNDESVKQKYLKRVEAHALADEIVKGKYWQDGKGCAVGCTIHGDQHANYETELGIPEWLARVEDTIFEGLPNERAMTWPKEFLEAIPIGARLEKIKTPFIIFILEENLKTLDALPSMAGWPDVKNAITLSREATTEMIRCHREGLDLAAARSAAWSAESAAWSAAESAAESAAWSAESAAWSAARSAARSAAWSAESAESAEWSAEWSAAWSAAWSAESAAWSAAWSAAESAAWSSESAAWSSESAAYVKYADKLLELLRGCQ